MRVLALVGLLAFTAPAVVRADDLAQPPNRLTQPLHDGCQRNAVGLLTNSTAHWTYVYRDNPGQQFVRVAEGIAGQSHVAAGDLPQAHDWYDLNFDLSPDPGYQYLTAGEPTLHIERESGNTPFFAYPSDGDRVKVWGNWVWDCGHWGPQDLTNKDFLLPGQGVTPLDGSTDVTSGESTEFHPWTGIVLVRSHPYLPQVQETEADVYIASNGTQAAAEAHCAKSDPPPPGVGALAFYAPDYTACDVNPSSRFQPVNDRNYTFFVPAPSPKPSAGAHLRWRVASSPGDGVGPTEIVTPRSDGIDVTVPFKGFGGATQDQAYAKSFFVGWDGDRQYLPAHLQVTIKDVVVHQTLGEPNPNHRNAAGDPFGRYGLTMNMNGYWVYLNDWAPGLDLIPQNETTFPVNRTFGINVPDGKPVSVHVDGRECDLPKVNPCPNTPEIADDNDDPGTAQDAFASSAAAVGDHTLKGISSNQLNYEIHYAVTLTSPARLGGAQEAPPVGGPVDAQGVPLAATGTPVSSSHYPNTSAAGTGSSGTQALAAGCPDTIAPRSRVARVRATRRGIRVAGSASDRACRGAGRVSVVMVAVGRRTGRLCRFLRADGRFGRPTSCLRTPYLRGAGTSPWSFIRRLRLPPGEYLVWSRAIDQAGNVEHKARSRNLARFRVR